MKTPKNLEPLIRDGVIDEVIRALKSGKEAAVYVVAVGDEVRCAKVYKEAAQRSFKHQAQYQEGRKVRNSRRARAMASGDSAARIGTGRVSMPRRRASCSLRLAGGHSSVLR